MKTKMYKLMREIKKMMLGLIIFAGIAAAGCGSGRNDQRTDDSLTTDTMVSDTSTMDRGNMSDSTGRNDQVVDSAGAGQTPAPQSR
ncbi:hypothetical protein BFS30_17955 [Pedobacter steynii]|uniref:Uncharacterized protein n=1 Tax=Pedobacter steynii TaxID=430522 RepID=A0A1D7QJX0_9SPHI|nr:hypothetical protein BFS30_17955 [Pedobacter steynii]